MEKQPYIAHINLSEFTLCVASLENLASEYYGAPLSIIGEEHRDICSIAFEDSKHPVLNTPIFGLDNFNGFMDALDSFRPSPAKE